jgi:hypothetical protein
MPLDFDHSTAAYSCFGTLKLFFIFVYNYFNDKYICNYDSMQIICQFLHFNIGCNEWAQSPLNES